MTGPELRWQSRSTTAAARLNMKHNSDKRITISCFLVFLGLVLAQSAHAASQQ
jgi:hypothetical protein